MPSFNKRVKLIIQRCVWGSLCLGLLCTQPLGAFQAQVHPTQCLNLTNEHNLDMFFSYFQHLSFILRFHLHILSTMLNCLKMQNSQAVHKLSHKVIGFQTLNIHSSITLLLRCLSELLKSLHIYSYFTLTF